MKPETYKNIKEELEKLKQDIGTLEKSIKSRKKSSIKESINITFWSLYRLYEKTTNKTAKEAIEYFKGTLSEYKHKIEEERNKGKEVSVKEIYRVWSEFYDEMANILTYLEGKISKDFIGKVKGQEILDLGCGTGRYTIPLARKGSKITAVDFSEEMLKNAKKKAKQENLDIEFSVQDITKYKPRKKFDKIISMLVFDHIKDLNKIVNILDKASKPGTEVIISNSNPEFVRKGFDPKKGKAKGLLIEGYKTDQYYHPLSEYVELFKQKDFYLTKFENIIFEKKYQHMKKFKGSLWAKDLTLGVVMKFNKMS